MVSCAHTPGFSFLARKPARGSLRHADAEGGDPRQGGLPVLLAGGETRGSGLSSFFWMVPGCPLWGGVGWGIFNSLTGNHLFSRFGVVLGGNLSKDIKRFGGIPDFETHPARSTWRVRE